MSAFAVNQTTRVLIGPGGKAYRGLLLSGTFRSTSEDGGDLILDLPGRVELDLAQMYEFVAMMGMERLLRGTLMIREIVCATMADELRTRISAVLTGAAMDTMGPQKALSPDWPKPTKRQRDVAAYDPDDDLIETTRFGDPERTFIRQDGTPVTSTRKRKGKQERKPVEEPEPLGQTRVIRLRE